MCEFLIYCVGAVDPILFFVRGWSAILLIGLIIMGITWLYMLDSPDRNIQTQDRLKKTIIITFKIFLAFTIFALCIPDSNHLSAIIVSNKVSIENINPEHLKFLKEKASLWFEEQKN